MFVRSRIYRSMCPLYLSFLSEHLQLEAESREKVNHNRFVYCKYNKTENQFLFIFDWLGQLTYSVAQSSHMASGGSNKDPIGAHNVKKMSKIDQLLLKYYIAYIWL